MEETIQISKENYAKIQEIMEDPEKYVQEQKKRKQEQIMDHAKKRLAEEKNKYTETNKKFEKALATAHSDFLYGKCQCGKFIPLTPEIFETHNRARALYGFWLCSNCKVLNESHAAFDPEASSFVDFLSITFLRELTDRSPLEKNPEREIKERILKGELK